MTMVDIQGLEDFFGDMDFKVGGTHKGITAIQVDIKIDGCTLDIILLKPLNNPARQGRPTSWMKSCSKPALSKRRGQRVCTEDDQPEDSGRQDS